MSSSNITPSSNGHPLRSAIRLDDDSDRTPTSSSASGKGLYSFDLTVFMFRGRLAPVLLPTYVLDI